MHHLEIALLQYAGEREYVSQVVVDNQDLSSGQSVATSGRFEQRLLCLRKIGLPAVEEEYRLVEQALIGGRPAHDADTSEVPRFILVMGAGLVVRKQDHRWSVM